MTKRKSPVLRNVEKDVQIIRTKLREHVESGQDLVLKKGCIYENGKIMMTCVMCKENKERTTEFFYPVNHCNTFLTSQPGHEVLQNSAHKPCRSCYTTMNIVRRCTRSGFIVNILMPYNDLTEEWLEEMLKKQNGKGLITNTMMNLTTHGQNCVGIHRYDNSLGHIPSNCFLEVQELNVQQGLVITSLFKAWTLVFNHFNTVLGGTEDTIDHLELFRKQYDLTPSQLGIPNGLNNKDYKHHCSRLHFKTIFRHRIRAHIKEDIKKNRFQWPADIDKTRFISTVYQNAIITLESQHECCKYTQIGLTHLRSWNQFSFERINNKLPHFTLNGKLENCVFICRLFNAVRQLSTTAILEYFLEQTLVQKTQKVIENTKSILGIR